MLMLGIVLGIIVVDTVIALEIRRGEKLMVQYFCDWCNNRREREMVQKVAVPILESDKWIPVIWEHTCAECLKAFVEEFIPGRKNAEVKESDAEMVKSRKGRDQ